MIQKIFSTMRFEKKFLANSMIVFWGSLAVSVINYLFRTSSGRLLGPENYGVIGFLISLISILQIFSTSINNAMTKFCATCVAQNKLPELRYIYEKFQKISFIIGLFIALVVFVLSEHISKGFKVDTIYIKYIAIAFIFIFASTVNKGVFQGKKLFGKYSFINIFEVLVKIGLFFALFYLGLGIKSAIFAIIGSVIISYAMSRIMLIKQLTKKIKKIDFKHIIRYFSLAFVSLGLFSLIAFIDIPLAKYYLNEVDAGYYAALSDIGKIIFYAIVPIVAVMFPIITDLYTKNKKHYKILLQTIGLIFILGIPALLIYNYYSQFVVKILYGESYIAISEHIFKMGLAMFILVFCNMFVQYFLSIKKNSFFWFIMAAVALEILLFRHFHTNIGQIINNLLISFGFLLVSFVIYYLVYKKEKIRNLIMASLSAD